MSFNCYNFYTCDDCSRYPGCTWGKQFTYSAETCLFSSEYIYETKSCTLYTSYVKYRRGITGVGTFWLVFFICYIVFGAVIGAVLYCQRTNKEGGNEPETSQDPMDMAFDKRFKKSEEAKGLRQLIAFIFYYARKGIFNLLSVLLGIILAILWGYTMGLYEFYLVWFILPWIDIAKRLYLPLAKVVGDVMDAIFGRCLRNFKTQPAWFTFGGINGNNNNIEYNKLATDDDDDYEQKFDSTSVEGDEYGLKFITAFPKSDEIDGIRKIERLCYDVCRIGGYNFLTGLIGVPFSLIWGLIYGILQFLITWFVNPSIKIYQMYLIPSGQLIGSLLNAIFGKCFRNVRAEPYYFGFGNNIKNIGKDTELVSITGTQGGPTAPSMLNEVTVPHDGNANFTDNNNNNKNIMAYEAVADGITTNQ